MSAAGLAEEIADVEGLFAGASATAMQELGMGLPGSGDAARHFSAWRAKLRSDAHVGRDARMLPLRAILTDCLRHKRDKKAK